MFKHFEVICCLYIKKTALKMEAAGLLSFVRLHDIKTQNVAILYIYI
jgi:hypothetical protein